MQHVRTALDCAVRQAHRQLRQLRQVRQPRHQGQSPRSRWGSSLCSSTPAAAIATATLTLSLAGVVAVDGADADGPGWWWGWWLATPGTGATGAEAATQITVPVPALPLDDELQSKITRRLKKELGRHPTREEVDAKLAKKLKKLGRWPRHPAAVHGVQMLTRDEVSEIALLVANVIPLAYFEYQDRVGIFEDAVARVAKGVENTLPRQYHRLIHHDPVAHSARDPEVNAAIAPEPPPSQQQHPGAGIDSELADSISSHLVPYILETVRLPHLGACDEKRVVTAVVDIMIQSMRTDRVIWQFCKGDYSKDIIVKVFMRGSIGKLFDPFQRAELIEKVLSNVKNVPFVPMSVLETVGGMMIDWVAQHVDRALHDSYHQRVHHHHDELLARGLKYHGDAVNKDLGGDIDPPIQTPHIRIYMRKNLGKYLDESIHPMPAPASLVPWVVGQILDHAVDTDRLEHIWLNHNFVEHLHRSPHAGAPTLRELKTAMDGGGGPDGGVSGDPDGGGQRGM